MFRLWLLETLGVPGKQVTQMVRQLLLALGQTPPADTVSQFLVDFLAQPHHEPLLYFLSAEEGICHLSRYLLCCRAYQSTPYNTGYI